MITKTYKTTLKDMLYFQYNHKSTRNTLLVTIPMFLFYIIYTIWIGQLSFVVLIPLIVGILFFLLYPYFSAKNALKQDVFFKYDTTVTFSDTTFLEVTEKSSNEVKWEDFYNYVITIYRLTRHILYLKIFSQMKKTGQLKQ